MKFLNKTMYRVLLGLFAIVDELACRYGSKDEHTKRSYSLSDQPSSPSGWLIWLSGQCWRKIKFPVGLIVIFGLIFLLGYLFILKGSIND